MKPLILLLFCVLILFSCKKRSMVDDLSTVMATEKGLLRIECRDCEIKYIVNEKEFQGTIKDGNADFSFSYLLGYSIKTQILSKEDQYIRLLILDSYGRVISNALTSFAAGEVGKGSFDLHKN